MAILPGTILELAAYGLVTGFLREKGFNIWTALLGAMVLGRLARLAFIFAASPQANPWAFIQMSWPGILLQLALIPIIIYLLQKFLFKNNGKAI